MAVSSKLAGRIKQLTDEDVEGIDIDKIKCRSCSGYGNCGYKTYHLYKDKALSVCNLRKGKYAEENGIEINF